MCWDPAHTYDCIVLYGKIFLKCIICAFCLYNDIIKRSTKRPRITKTVALAAGTSSFGEVQTFGVLIVFLAATPGDASLSQRRRRSGELFSGDDMTAPLTRSGIIPYSSHKGVS